MSADNGYVVGPLDQDGKRWGVWHYFVSGGLDSTEQEPQSTHASQSDALTAAYEADDPDDMGFPGSEYGVIIVNEYPIYMEGF